MLALAYCRPMVTPNIAIDRQDAVIMAATKLMPDVSNVQFIVFSAEVNGFHGENYKRLANLMDAL